MKLPKQKVNRILSFSWRDLLISAAIFGCATGACFLLHEMADTTDGFASPVYVLAVLLISRFTNGYLFGLIAAVLGVIGVNYVFTYPYMAFNFTISGYPLTIFTFLVVSLVTSALTTKTKEQDRLRLENERVKMRADLLRSVSHDIRTPLTSIIGATSAVLENPTLPDAEQKALLADVRDDAQWLIRVVENLLSITRIGNDPAKISKESMAAEEVLSEAVGKFRKRFPGVSVEVHVPDNLLMVPMDPILIVQVLSNLLENAVFHGLTTSRIQLSVRREGSWACFSVLDNGQGIPPQKLPGLFDGTLKQEDSSGGASPGDGRRNMGLGLSVCMAIVRAHGGSMDAKNTQTGAEFTFRLPLSEEEPQHDDP